MGSLPAQIQIQESVQEKTTPEEEDKEGLHTLPTHPAGEQGEHGLKVYIPLRRKIPGVGGWRWAMPPTPEFCVGDTNMLVYFGVTPDASQWNIGWVPTQNTGVGHVHFMFFCVDFICVWYPTRTPFPVEYGLKKADMFVIDRKNILTTCPRFPETFSN